MIKFPTRNEQKEAKIKKRQKKCRYLLFGTVMVP